MAEIWRFLRSLGHHWQARITGGFFAAVFVMGEGLKLFDAPPLFYAIFGILAAGFASFQTWRDEAKSAAAFRAELQECRDQARRAAEVDTEVILDVPNSVYWMLAVTQKYGLSRAWLEQDHTGAKLNAIWIGESPVSHRDCGWLYSLANADKWGLLPLEYKQGGNGNYRLTHEATRILDVSRRRKRPIPDPPGPLHDARTGQPFTIAPPA